MSTESHLKHKKALLDEAKDDRLNHEITEAAYQRKLRVLLREIKDLEASQ